MKYKILCVVLLVVIFALIGSKVFVRADGGSDQPQEKSSFEEIAEEMIETKENVQPIYNTQIEIEQDGITYICEPKK